MSVRERLTDDAIARAFERRAAGATADGLREAILAQAVSTAQATSLQAPIKSLWRPAVRPAWAAIILLTALLALAIAAATIGTRPNDPGLVHVAIPAEPGAPAVDLTFDQPAGVTVDGSPAYLASLRWPGNELSVWWRVGAVNGDPCPGPGATYFDDSRQVSDPSATQAYEAIRSATVLDVSPESEFGFAGSTGRSVVIALRDDARAACASTNLDRGSLILTSAGRGYEAGHILLPFDGSLRLGIVRVAGHDLLLAGAASTSDGARQATVDFDEIRAVAQPAPSIESAGPAATIAGRYEIGGRSLYLECRGRGAPTIVLDAGAGNDTSTWASVLPGVSRVARVCAYDRANVGRSDPAPTPRTLADTVADLNVLLSRGGIAPPYVLVGHSFGGLDVRLYAATYPSTVEGIVLLDATPVSFVNVGSGCARLSPAAFQTIKEIDSNPESLVPSAADIAAIEAYAPDVPSRVIAATDHGDPSATGLEIERLAATLQAELAASWPGGGLVVAQGGHYVQDEHPELVVQAVEGCGARRAPPIWTMTAIGTARE